MISLHLYVGSKIVKLTEGQSRMMVRRAWAVGEGDETLVKFQLCRMNMPPDCCTAWGCGEQYCTIYLQFARRIDFPFIMLSVHHMN